MTEFTSILGLVREKAPVVDCITNFVTVNDCANILLASGGSPSMSQDIREVRETVRGVQALVCNMGAIDFVDSMCAAGREANLRGIPVVLDPVAVGGSALRRTCAARLLKEVRFTAIRGNASEIRYLAGQNTLGSGVDVSALDRVTEENIPEAVEMVRTLARSTGSVIALSGVLDVISDGSKTALLRNGCAAMARITGSGCMVTSLIGAFCGACPDRPFEATVSAMAAMGVCGELAEATRVKNGTGNASFRTYLIDSMFNLTEKQFKEAIRCEIY